ncbi:hypothetical protein ENSA5_31750 [Enhygromyxa salina]|uniref:Uncharacterized protein n=1 Tax=Enhygromyxa salina TaxID=215803 RepID=A0A2S9XXS3_9BACT|nr:hypothetical protein [Enhygromyxa salina]PRP97668.1 hypothetical protein ENSA5_31750 [Enhygromyxa salina]
MARPRHGLTPQETYLDLAEAVERGAVAGNGKLEPDGLRACYTIGIGTWEAMLSDLLDLLATDAGSAREALIDLGVPTELLSAWGQSPMIGTKASVEWLAARRADPMGRIALGPSARAFRGDDYLDLAEVGTRPAIAGDGALDPARLRQRYTIERGPWLRMVADLLGQLVGDAGSVEHAATVLAVRRPSLGKWVRWFVSRGSVDAARSRWPVAPGDDTPTSAAYLDLAEAVERGRLAFDNPPELSAVSDSYTVRLDNWERMTADLLRQIVADSGSIRKASKVVKVPRTTLATWVREGRRRWPR